MCLRSNRANIGEQSKFPGDSPAWKAEAPAQHGLMAAKAPQAERRAEPRMGTGTRRKMGTEDISVSVRTAQDALQAEGSLPVLGGPLPDGQMSQNVSQPNLKVHFGRRNVEGINSDKVIYS